MNIENLITTESVGAGHPDKICDQIADNILDKFLNKDKNAKVAVEVVTSHNKISIMGEVRSNAYVDVVKAAWEILFKYDYTETDFEISSSIHEQSPEINNAVTKVKNKIFSSDQGIMFGYATNELENYMPLSFVLANELLKKLKTLIQTKKIKWLKWDMKSQVIFNYEDPKNLILKKITLSIQHDKNWNKTEAISAIKKQVITPLIKKYRLNNDFKLNINKNGLFTIGGPIADSGLTGRKIIVDTYGAHARHGGGSFSGKDYTKPDRTGAYFARWIAKNVVAAKLADKCEIQISYEYGEQKVNSLFVNTFTTEKVPLKKIIYAIKKVFLNMTLTDIQEQFNLKKIKYLPLSTFGHFGREEFDYEWEKINMTTLLKQNI